jgi:CRP-like cAMP-binding protein
VEARTDVYTLALHLDRYREILQKDPAFLLFLSRTLANKLNGATISSSRDLPLRKRVLLSLQQAREGQTFNNIGHLAKTLNVSSRQLLRVLKDLCREGFLVHREKGVYEVLRVPGPDLPTKSSVHPENQASSPSSQTEGQP